MATGEHDAVALLLAPFALDALTDGDKALVTQHFRSCAECRQEASALAAVAAVLPLALPPVAAPGLRQRLLQSAVGLRREPIAVRTRGRRLSAVAAAWSAAALFLACLGLGTWGARERQQRHGSEYLTLAGVGPAAAASGRLVLSDDRPARLSVRDLSPPASDQVYEAWLVRAGRPIAAGIFVTSAAGAGDVTLTRTPDMGDQVVITREPAPGGPVPRGTAVLESRT